MAQMLLRVLQVLVSFLSNNDPPPNPLTIPNPPDGRPKDYLSAGWCGE